MSVSPRKIEALGLLIGLLAGFGVTLNWLAFRDSGHHPSPVAATTDPPPVQERSASDGLNPAALDAEWTAYSDRSGCADWAGGDGVSAIRLSPDQLAWFFSDSYLGPAGPTIGFSRLSGFLHNSVVIQTMTGGGSTFVTMTGGGACLAPGQPSARATSVVAPPLAPGGTSDRYWDADGIEINGMVDKFYNRFLPGEPPFIPTGTVIATFPVSELSAAGRGQAYGAVARPAVTSLPSYTPPGSGAPIVWGAALLRTGNTVYVYGTRTPYPSAPGRQLYLARVPAARLTQFSAWRFYAGAAGWAAGQQDAQPVQPSGSVLTVATGFSVVEITHRYWLIQAGALPGSADINAYPAATPWGPFDPAAAIRIFHDSAIGLDAAHDYRIMYEARAEPALSTGNTLVISYNVNSPGVTTGCVPMSDYTNTVTQPRFITAPLGAFGENADLSRYSVTTGPLDYPSIVQRNPAQWFNGWSYPSGCPPVPGVTDLRARTQSGAVTLSWSDAGLGVRYQVYLLKPGATAVTPATTRYTDSATISGLAAGAYLARVVPVNAKQTPGNAAQVRFALP